MKSRYNIPLFFLVSTIPVFLLVFYNDAIISTNQYLFEVRGDAIKNYFTYVSQIRSDHLLWADFINYPYGEHFLYLDCHPLLTVILNYLDPLFPSLAQYHIGILNTFMLLSLPVSSVFMYLILRELRVSPWWAVAGALGLMFMSPQVFRMTGHFALSYPLFLPLTWYLYIRFRRGQMKYGWSVAIALNILFWFFIHGYLGMISATFVGIMMILDYALFQQKQRSFGNVITSFIIQVIVPMVMFYGLLQGTDMHIGRTDNPFGFFVHTATFQSVFLPHHPPFKPIVSEFMEVNHQPWSGWSYIGLTSVAMILIWIIGYMTRFKKPGWIFSRGHNEINQNPILLPALLSGIILLVFSMAIPFRWGLEFLLDWFPVVKKFRATGRFAWVFYYTAGVSSIYMLHYLCENYQGKWKRATMAMAIVAMGMYFWEGYPWHVEVSHQISKHPNYFTEKDLPRSYQDALNLISDKKYQALIPLPFFNKGSENFSVEGTNKIYKQAMVLAYHSEVPVMASYSTHTSIPEAKNMMQILSPGYYPKNIQQDLPAQTDFLLVYSKEKLNKYEKALYDKGSVIYEDKDFTISRLRYEDLFLNTATDEIERFTQLQKKGVIKPQGDFMVSDSAGIVLYENYEGLNNPVALEGNGAYTGQIKDFNLLYQIPDDSLESGKNYIASFWMYNGGDNFGQDVLNSLVYIRQKGPDQIDWISTVNPSNSMVINDMWTLVELPFIVEDASHNYSVYLKGSDLKDVQVTIDELLIRETDNMVYKVWKTKDGQVTSLMKNNHRIHRP